MCVLEQLLVRVCVLWCDGGVCVLEQMLVCVCLPWCDGEACVLEHCWCVCVCARFHAFCQWNACKTNQGSPTPAQLAITKTHSHPWPKQSHLHSCLNLSKHTPSQPQAITLLSMPQAIRPAPGSFSACPKPSNHSVCCMLCAPSLPKATQPLHGLHAVCFLPAPAFTHHSWLTSFCEKSSCSSPVLFCSMKLARSKVPKRGN